jgi:tetratricopeptide (TPR) repeat protein
MRGMAIRYQINTLISENDDLKNIVDLTKIASTSFENARELSPDDEHGYISEIQLLSKVLDYAGKTHSEGVLGYLKSSRVDPFMLSSLERAEDLLEMVRRNREGQGEISMLEEDCRGKLDTLYGKYDSALQVWNNLLERNDNYHPPLRRQIIRTHLARRKRSWSLLTERELNRIKQLLEDNLQEEPSNDKDLRLWVQAVRWSKQPPSLESVTERISHWKTNSNSLESVYYLYLLCVLLTLQGSAQAGEDAKRNIEQCRQMSYYRKNRIISFEWLGNGSEITRLVHHSELGRWNADSKFWENINSLTRVKGRIKKIKSPQQGFIEIKGGLEVFFVPSRSSHSTGQSENRLVDFYLGFSYDGLRAWEVQDVH